MNQYIMKHRRLFLSGSLLAPLKLCRKCRAVASIYPTGDVVSIITKISIQRRIAHSNVRPSLGRIAGHSTYRVVRDAPVVIARVEPSGNLRCCLRDISLELVRDDHSCAASPGGQPMTQLVCTKQRSILEQDFAHLHHVARLDPASMSIQTGLDVVELKPGVHRICCPVCIRHIDVCTLAQGTVPQEHYSHVQRPHRILRKGYRLDAERDEALAREKQRIL